jgi:hypothetical protein
MQPLFGQIVEILWWALLGAVAVALVVRSLRDLLAARRRAKESASSLAPLIRRYEEEQLARMEAEGVPLWRPDPAKLKRISERQS